MSIINDRHNISDIAYICSCAVNGAIPKQEGYLTTLDFDLLYDVAEKHMLAALVGLPLNRAGISSPQFQNAVALAQRKTVILDNDMKNVTVALEAAGIWYMPLKGAVLKDLYPHFAMREMADTDIYLIPHKRKN